MWSKPLLCRFRQSEKNPLSPVLQGLAAFCHDLTRIPPRHSQTVCGNLAYYTSFLRVLQEGETLRMGGIVGLQYILDKSITQDMACRQSNEVRGEIRRESCQPEIQQKPVIHLLLEVALGRKCGGPCLPVPTSAQLSEPAHSGRTETHPGYAPSESPNGLNRAMVPPAAARVHPPPRKSVPRDAQNRLVFG